MYKMLVLDLDGTLLNSDKNVSPEDALAIKRAHEKGLKIVVATGRPPSGTVEARAALNGCGDEFLITYNGALIQKGRTCQTIASHQVTVADYLAIADFAKSWELFCYAYALDACLTPEKHEITDWEGQLNHIAVRLTDFSQLDPAEPLVKVMLTGKPAGLDQAKAAVPADFMQKYSICKSESFLLEFLHPLASKGQAVRELSGLLNLSREEIICMGDSGNDEDMIRFAGLGVAMGNAGSAIKAAADYVTRSNDAHGVAEVLERFVLI